MSKVSDWALWACANQQIGQHGDDALLTAAQRTDALLDAGDSDGHATWLAILSRIEQLTAAVGPGLPN